MLIIYLIIRYINNNKFTGDINITENSKLKYL